MDSYLAQKRHCCGKMFVGFVIFIKSFTVMITLHKIWRIQDIWINVCWCWSHVVDITVVSTKLYFHFSCNLLNVCFICFLGDRRTPCQMCHIGHNVFRFLHKMFVHRIQTYTHCLDMFCTSRAVAFLLLMQCTSYTITSAMHIDRRHDLVLLTDDIGPSWHW